MVSCFWDCYSKTGSVIILIFSTNISDQDGWVGGWLGVYVREAMVYPLKPMLLLIFVLLLFTLKVNAVYGIIAITVGVVATGVVVVGTCGVVGNTSGAIIVGGNGSSSTSTSAKQFVVFARAIKITKESTLRRGRRRVRVRGRRDRSVRRRGRGRGRRVRGRRRRG